MAWQDHMVPLLRDLIGDNGDTVTYTDSRLEQVIMSAAQLTLKDVDFAQPYQIQIPQSSISPDPTAPVSGLVRDDAFINIVTLKAAYIIVWGEFRTESGKAMMIKDGPSVIDRKAIVQYKQQVATMYKNEYANVVKQYRAGNSIAGMAIVGPHRFSMMGYSGGTQYDYRNSLAYPTMEFN